MRVVKDDVLVIRVVGLGQRWRRANPKADHEKPKTHKNAGNGETVVDVHHGNREYEATAESKGKRRVLFKILSGFHIGGVARKKSLEGVLDHPVGGVVVGGGNDESLVVVTSVTILTTPFSVRVQ
jgi:hypothetical protein